MLEVGQIVERYEVEAPLGEGGMAAVYRVRHTQLGTLHALKVLTLSNKAIRERLLTEGRVQATLQHPNAVAVQDVLDVDGVPCLLMEFVDGPDLSAWIDAEDHDLAEAERIFRGIVSAVAEAHGRGLVHRDLKPANVLMSRTATGWVPKVADFGLAKLVIDSTGPGSDHGTRTGVTMGTPAYMAPEQIRDAKNVDQRADVFSLGCILYELVTRHQPFVGSDIVELFTAVTGGDYRPPREHVPDLPARIEATVAGCLEVDPERRFDSCEAILEALGRPDGDGRPTPVAVTSPAAATTLADPDDAEPHAAEPSAAAPVEGPRAPAPVEASSPAPGRSGRLPEAPPQGAIAALLALPVAVLAVGGTSTLIVVAAAAWWIGSTAVDAVERVVSGYPCGGGEGEVVGYVSAGPIFLKRAGSTWTLPREREVVADYPNEVNDFQGSELVVCTLPGGTSVELREEPLRVRGSGAWIAVEADAITLPPEPEEEEEAAEE